MEFKNPIHLYCSLVIGFIMLSGSMQLNAQNQYLEGPETANVGDTKNYYLDDPLFNISLVQFWLSSGDIIYESPDGKSVDIQFFNTGSSNTVEVSFQDIFSNFYYETMDNINVSCQTPPAPTLGAITQPTCTESTGSFTISNYDSSTSYTVTPSTGVSISGATVTAPPGSYTIKGLVTFQCGYSSDTSFTIASPPSGPSTPEAIQDDPCTSSDFGSITITQPLLSGYEYSFNNGATYGTTTTKTNLSPGTYTIKVRDSNGCVSPGLNVTINSATPIPTPSVSITDPDCASVTGSLEITSPIVSGYTYSFDNGATYGSSTSKTNLSPGTYTVKVRNANGCTSEATATIASPPTAPATPTIGTITQPTCSVTTGSFTITNHSSGTSYTVTPSTGVVISGATVTAPSGSYTIKSTSPSHCGFSADRAFTIASPLVVPEQPEAIYDDPCTTSDYGSIIITQPIISGYEYSFDNGATYGTATSKTNLSPGTYTLKVRSQDGCVSPGLNVTINTATPIQTPSMAITNPNCATATGSLTIISPIVSGYTYSFDNGATYGSATSKTNLSPGTYTVKVRNTNGCTSEATATIAPQPSTPSAPGISTITQPTVATATGSVVLTGLPSGNWTINPGSIAGSGTSTTISGLTASTTYNFTVTNASGCISNTSGDVVVNCQPPAAPTYGTIVQPTCSVSTGSFTITNYDGASTYTVTPSAGVTISGSSVIAPPGSYTIGVENALGCMSANTAFTITSPPSAPSAPGIGLITQPTVETATGSVVLTGLPSGNWTVSPGGVTGSGTSTTVIGLMASTTYNFTVTDDSGCISAASGDVVVACQPPAAPTYGTLVQPTCSVSTGSFTITNYDGSNSYTITPATGVTISGSSVIAAPGSYILSASLNGCESSFVSVEISEPEDCDLDPLDQNYVYKRTYQEERTDVPSVQFDTDNGYVQDITYFDGLGRPMQQNAIRQSPVDEKDIITHIGYDSYGRMEKEWLPFHEPAGAIGEYRTGDMEQATNDFYGIEYSADFPTETNAYSQKKFEDSPLNRVLKQAAPGEDWKLDNGHEIEFAYESNTSADNVALFEVTTNEANNTYVPTLEKNSTYADGELFKNVTYDENHTTGKNHSTEEFTDKQGMVVLKRTYADMDLNGDGDMTDAGETEVAHDTYYVYDDYGNLTYVLPPKMDAGSATLANINAAMDELGYQYVYDFRNRLVEKQIPGKGREYIVYNKLDQPILTQDANQRDKDSGSDEWLFTKYDAFGRVAYTGLAEGTEGETRENVQAEVDGITQQWVTQQDTDMDDDFTEDVTIYYDNVSYPNNSLSNRIVDLTEVLTINYYDDYVDAPTGAPGSVTVWGSDPQENNRTNVQGLATVSKVKVLDISPVQWITTLTYYDKKSRPIYTYSENEYLGTVDIVESKLDFVGRPQQVRTEHTRDSETVVTLDNFTYDHVGRLLKQTQCLGDGTLGYTCEGYTGPTISADLILDSGTVDSDQVATNSITAQPVVTISGANGPVTLSVDPNAGGSGGAEELIVENTYDELGQMESKKVGGLADAATPLQTVNYTYNVRGWLKQINDPTSLGSDLFAFGINYNTVAHSGTALYNGNISETEWRTANTDNSLKWYRYTYDALNRLTTAVDDTPNMDYRVHDLAYDKNGNIQALSRRGQSNISATSFGWMDVLTYQYDAGNKLTRVDDAGPTYGFNDGNTSGDDYRYDANGNMVMDKNKGIGSETSEGIEYNHLNLPTKITVTGTNAGTIDYVYDATGTKLRKEVSTGTVTEYAGNYIYEGNNTSTSLQFFNHPEGYVSPSVVEGQYNYVYQYKDHLGNVRLSFSDGNGDGDIDVTTDPMTTEIVEENNYYPFGLKHKGYNDGTTALGNDVANRWKYNGIELDETSGLYEMDLRRYDPAIARWTSIDPVTHFSNSTYNAFDNNPVFWADPSGADSIYNWETGQYVINGQVVSQSEAIAYAQNGGNADGSNNNKPGGSQSTQPKYQFFGISPTGEQMNLSFDNENFNILTGYGEDPEDTRKAKLDAYRAIFKALDTKDQVRVLRFLKIHSRHWLKILNVGGKVGPASLMPGYDVHEEGLARLPLGLGFTFQPQNDDWHSQTRQIENVLKWDDVMAGFNEMMKTEVLNDVIIIYSNENLYNKSTINVNEAEHLETRHATGNYKYAYYGTQYGNNLHIFGMYLINND